MARPFRAAAHKIPNHLEYLRKTDLKRDNFLSKEGEELVRGLVVMFDILGKDKFITDLDCTLSLSHTMTEAGKDLLKRAASEKNPKLIYASDEVRFLFYLLQTDLRSTNILTTFQGHDMAHQFLEVGEMTPYFSSVYAGSKKSEEDINRNFGSEGKKKIYRSDLDKIGKKKEVIRQAVSGGEMASCAFFSDADPEVSLFVQNGDTSNPIGAGRAGFVFGGDAGGEELPRVEVDRESDDKPWFSRVETGDASRGIGLTFNRLKMMGAKLAREIESKGIQINEVLYNDLAPIFGLLARVAVRAGSDVATYVNTGPGAAAAGPGPDYVNSAAPAPAAFRASESGVYENGRAVGFFSNANGANFAAPDAPAAATRTTPTLAIVPNSGVSGTGDRRPVLEEVVPISAAQDRRSVPHRVAPLPPTGPAVVVAAALSKALPMPLYGNVAERNLIPALLPPASSSPPSRAFGQKGGGLSTPTGAATTTTSTAVVSRNDTPAVLEEGDIQTIKELFAVVKDTQIYRASTALNKVIVKKEGRHLMINVEPSTPIVAMWSVKQYRIATDAIEIKVGEGWVKCSETEKEVFIGLVRSAKDYLQPEADVAQAAGSRRSAASATTTTTTTTTTTAAPRGNGAAASSASAGQWGQIPLQGAVRAEGRPASLQQSDLNAFKCLLTNNKNDLGASNAKGLMRRRGEDPNKFEFKKPLLVEISGQGVQKGKKVELLISSIGFTEREGVITELSIKSAGKAGEINFKPGDQSQKVTEIIEAINWKVTEKKRLRESASDGGTIAETEFGVEAEASSGASAWEVFRFAEASPVEKMAFNLQNAYNSLARANGFTFEQDEKGYPVPATPFNIIVRGYKISIEKDEKGFPYLSIHRSDFTYKIPIGGVSIDRVSHLGQEGSEVGKVVVVLKMVDSELLNILDLLEKGPVMVESSVGGSPRAAGAAALAADGGRGAGSGREGD